MTARFARRHSLGRSAPLLAGLLIQAGCTYLTLIVAGRLLGAARFGGLAALYVAVTTMATGLFLPVEQEIARRYGHDRVETNGEGYLIRRTTALAMSAAGVVIAAAVVAHGLTLHILNGEVHLLVALCIALPGYACCFVSRGLFSGTGELPRYGVQLGVEGVFRLAGVAALAVAHEHSVAPIGYLFAAAPWVALAVSLFGRARQQEHGTAARRPLVRPLGLLLVSALAAQVLVNSGPLVVQVLSNPEQRARAGAFLAALVVVRVPVFLFTAVQPSFLPAMAAHNAANRRREFVRLVRGVASACVALTVATTVVMTVAGAWALRLLFDFRAGLSDVQFLALGLAVGLFLLSTVLAQALLARGLHAATSLGWLAGLVGLAAGAAAVGDPVTRATTGLLTGALVACMTFALLLSISVRQWRLNLVEELT